MSSLSPVGLSLKATNTDSSTGFVLPEISQVSVLLFHILVTTRLFPLTSLNINLNWNVLHRCEEVIGMTLKCKAFFSCVEKDQFSFSSATLTQPMFISRSTLCSVMAQLTEDIQPSFERTLKSKAVSEKCNVKFTCVVSGMSFILVFFYVQDKNMKCRGVVGYFQNL